MNFHFALNPQSFTMEVDPVVNLWISSTSLRHHGKFESGVIWRTNTSTVPLQFSHVRCFCKRGLLNILLMEAGPGFFVLGFSKLEKKCVSWFTYSLSYFWCCQSKIWQPSDFWGWYSNKKMQNPLLNRCIILLLFCSSLIHYLTCGHIIIFVVSLSLLYLCVSKWAHTEMKFWIG